MIEQLQSQLSVRDAAGLLRVDRNTIYRWIQNGQLAVNRVNGQYRFKQTSLLACATSRNLECESPLCADHVSPSQRTGRLTEALHAGGVFHAVAGSDKPSALLAVVEAMSLPPGIDRNLLYQLLLARESLGSTGIGDGIAVPHPRSPIVVRVDRPAIVLCFLQKPIDFGASDGRPVHTLFTLVSPTVRDHLRLLSGLAFALRDANFRQAVVHQASAEEILGAAQRIEEKLKQWSAAPHREAA